MTTPDHDRSDPVEDYIAAYVTHLDGEGPHPDLDDLDDEDRDEAAAQVELLETARASAVDHDVLERIAQRFGFDRPNERIGVSGSKLKAARSRQGVSLGDIASAATAAGVSVRPAELLKIETGSGAALTQEVVTFLAAFLETTVPELEDDSDELNQAQTFLYSDVFNDLIATWCLEHGRDEAAVREHVSDAVLDSSRRAEDLTEAQLIEFVEAMLRQLEQR